MNKNNATIGKATPAVSSLQVLLVTTFAGIFFGVVSPTPASSLAVIAGSVTLCTVSYVWFALFVRLLAAFWPFPTRQQRVLAVALTLIVMFLILMQSIGELSWRDAFAVIPLVVILYVYATYASREQPAQGHPGH